MNVHSVAGGRELKRDTILNAALACFVERGFHGTAIPRISDEAEVGAGTIYRYFENKEALVNALYRRCKVRLLDHLMGDFPLEASPREQFSELWARLTSFAREQPQALAFLELHHHQPYLDDESRRLELASLEPIVGLFARAVQAGAVRAVAPEVLISLVWGAFVGLLKSARLGYLELSDPVVAASEACCWYMVSNNDDAGGPR